MKHYKKGDLVAVINSTFSGKFFVECRNAEVVGPNPHGDDSSYLVRIDGETFPRFIDPAAQADPGAFVQRLNGLTG